MKLTKPSELGYTRMMADFSPQFIEKRKVQLLALRSELQAQGEHNREALETVELDQSKVGRLSRMDALQAQEMAKENERRRLLQLRRIKAALERLETGEYGYCVNTGEPIDKKRLELDPAAPTAIEHSKL